MTNTANTSKWIKDSGAYTCAIAFDLKGERFTSTIRVFREGRDWFAEVTHGDMPTSLVYDCGAALCERTGKAARERALEVVISKIVNEFRGVLA